jgi:hypothetical protein
MATKSINPTTRETSATTFDRGERNLNRHHTSWCYQNQT